MSEFDYEPMSEKRLAEIIDENERCDDGSWGVHRVAELLDEVLRARHFETELRGERDQARAELAEMREKLGEARIEWASDAPGCFLTFPEFTEEQVRAMVDGVRSGGGTAVVKTRLVGQWREVEGGGEHG